MSELSGDILIKTAINIAAQAHGDQLYGNKDYMFHLTEVAELATAMEYPDEVIAGCFLHDTLEDTYFTARDMIRGGIPLVVVEGVQAVTYVKGEETLSKIDKAKGHPIGHVIKFCDSSRNFATTVNRPYSIDNEKRMKRAREYAQNLGALAIDLPTPNEIDRFIHI